MGRTAMRGTFNLYYHWRRRDTGAESDVYECLVCFVRSLMVRRGLGFRRLQTIRLHFHMDLVRVNGVMVQ